METLKVNHSDANTDGSLQGYLYDTTKEQIKKVIGRANVEQLDLWNIDLLDKILTEWTLVFPDGASATIYDWKLDKPLEQTEEYRWHIGGKSFDVVDRITRLLKGEDKYEIDNEEHNKSTTITGV
jgi:hypothetical protein